MTLGRVHRWWQEREFQRSIARLKAGTSYCVTLRASARRALEGVIQKDDCKIGASLVEERQSRSFYSVY